LNLTNVIPHPGLGGYFEISINGYSLQCPQP
jgi:predicted Rdx family selenoprotein